MSTQQDITMINIDVHNIEESNILMKKAERRNLQYTDSNVLQYPTLNNITERENQQGIVGLTKFFRQNGHKWHIQSIPSNRSRKIFLSRTQGTL